MKTETIDFLINALFILYDIIKHQSDNTTLLDVYWAISNLALTDAITKGDSKANYRTDIVCSKIL